MRVTRRRVLALGLVGAVVASVGIGGPLASPAGAVTETVYTAGQFTDAIEDINLTSGQLHSITLGDDLVFDGAPGGSIDVAAAVEIYGGGHRVSCINSCGTWLTLNHADVDVNIADVSVGSFTGSAVLVGAGDLTVVDSVFADNHLSTAGIDVRGSAINSGFDAGNELYLEDVQFVNNAVTASAGNFAGGGAVHFVGYVTIIDSSFTNNSVTAIDALARGGALMVSGEAVDRTYIRGTTFDGNEVNSIDDDANLNNNWSEGGAASLANLAENSLIVDSTFTGNSSDYNAGAIDNRYSASLQIDESAFIDNSAGASGGALVAIQMALMVTDTHFARNDAFDYGGAIWAVDSSDVRIDRSLVENNYARWGGGVAAEQADVDITNSTLTSNEADYGSAVYAETDSDFDMSHLTVARNENLGASDGGQFYVDAASAYLENSVIAERVGGTDNCGFAGGDMESGGYNRVDDASCGLGAPTDVESASFDGALGPLQFSGGPTDTILPAQGSVLIDAMPLPIDGGPCATGSRDQRGVERYRGAACDIGAVEVFAPLEFDVETIGGTVHVTVYNAMSMPYSPRPYAPDEFPETPMPAGSAFPYGALGLYIEVWDDGGWPVDVEIETPAPTTQLWKLMGGGWNQYPGTVDGNVWAFHLVDGAEGDNDGAANGAIADPVAVGYAASFTG